MWRSKARDLTAFCLGIVLIGCLMQAAGAIKGDTLVFPEVPAILRAFVRLLGRGETWRMLGTTMKHVAASMAIATVVGVGLGLLMGQIRFVRGLLTPLMALLRALPMIVLIVMVMVMTRYERVPVTASVMILVPMIAEAASEGCRRIEPELLDVYRMNSGFNLKVLRHVHLPLMAGYLRQAWVNAAGMAVKLAVSTEYLVQTKNSMGKAVLQSFNFVEYEEVYAYALILVLMVAVVSALPRLLLREKN